ncbi:MAG: hypothetical protein ACYDFT_05445 [Thermoplasmata archaeon]
MRKSIVAWVLVGILMFGGLLAASTSGISSGGSTSMAGGATVGSAFGPAPYLSVPSVTTDTTTYSRTVLIETFTAVWCIHCPAESAALFNIDRSTNRSVIDIAELHVCAFAPGQGPCLDNYVPPDGTSNARAAFYNACGFPDVFFDGNNSACGATNSIPQMQAEYESYIANASAVPGGVSISQSASVASHNVTEQAVITPGITGTYNAISYLVEYIGLQNVSDGYGPHDIGNVVRATLLNHPVNLVAGTPLTLTARGVINPAWNSRNLSVVTFIQQNSTKFVENANMVPVTTLTAAVSSNPSSVPSGTSSTVTVQVANSSTGVALAGATVNLSSSLGGVFTPASGVTNGSGTFTATYLAPSVTASETDQISAQVAMPGYTGGIETANIDVTARVAPDVPQGLVVTPGNGQVFLNWSAPLSGAGGVTYHVFRSTARAGVYSMVASASTTQFVDSSVQTGQTYWYTVDANNSEAYSVNTTAVSASSVTAVSQGLPTTDGWWLSIGPYNFTSPTSASVDLYLPNGNYTYQFGPGTYAYEAPQSTGSFTVAATSLSFNATFLPRYATIDGTVSPSNATVTLNGTNVSVVDGTFLQPVIPGVYAMKVAAWGYQSSTSTIILTPGNTTPIHVKLVPTSHPTPIGPSSSGLTNDQMFVIIAVIALVAVAVLGTVAIALRKRKGQQPPSTGTP